MSDLIDALSERMATGTASTSRFLVAWESGAGPTVEESPDLPDAEAKRTWVSGRIASSRYAFAYPATLVLDGRPTQTVLIGEESGGVRQATLFRRIDQPAGRGFTWSLGDAIMAWGDDFFLFGLSGVTA
jgi:hypothetical protein